MALYVNDLAISEDVADFVPEHAWPLATEGLLGARWGATNRGPSGDHGFTLVLQAGRSDIDQVIASLRGIAETSPLVLLRSTTQNLWGPLRALYVKIEKVSPTRPPGFPDLGVITISGAVVGIPASEGGDALLGHYWHSTPAPTLANEALYYPWGEGGRNGLETVSPPLTWNVRSTAGFAVVVANGGLWSMGKEPDGAYVMRVSGTLTGQSVAALAGSTAANGYFSTTFRSTVIGHGLLTRLSSSAIDSTGYLLHVESATSLRFYKKTGAGAYTALAAAVTVPTLNDGNPHTLGVHWNGSNYACFLDGACILVGSDSSYGAAGYMGLRATTAPVSWAETGHLPHLGAPVAPISARASLFGHTEAARLLTRPVGRNILAGFEDLAWVAEVGSFTIDATTSRTSGRSLKFTGSGSARRVRLATSLPAGRAYLLEGWYKASPSATGLANAYLKAYDATATPDLNLNSTPATSGTCTVTWQPLGLTFTAPKASPTLYLYGGDGGDVWVDDVVLREVQPALVQPLARRLCAKELTS